MAKPREALSKQIHFPILSLKLSGTLLVCYRDKKYLPYTKFILICAAFVFIVIDTTSIYRICQQFQEIANGNARTFSSFLGKICFQTIICMCVRSIAFQCGKVADLLNSFQQIQDESVAAINNYKSKLFCLAMVTYSLLFVLNDIYTSFSKKNYLHNTIAYVYQDIVVASLTFQIFFILSLLIAFLRRANLTLTDDHLSEIKTQKLRKSVGIIFKACYTFQEIYGPAILSIITCRSLYFMMNAYILTENLATCLFYNRFDFKSLNEIGYSCMWLFLNIAPVHLIIHLCAKTEKEVKNVE